MKNSVPILLYHHVSPDREITPLGLERQLGALLEKGYCATALEELMGLMEKKGDIPPKTFVVTFDDGYLDNWVYAFPVLKKLKVSATIFLVTERIESCPDPRMPQDELNTRRAERELGGWLSWAECRRMQESGLVRFGSHTHTHRHFKRGESYQNLNDELQKSKALIEKNLARPCPTLAWPWGDFEKSWWPSLQKAGYKAALTTLSGANTNGTPLFNLKRLKVSQESPEWLLGRMGWHSSAVKANLFGSFYGWDRRFKTWISSESPYSHG